MSVFVKSHRRGRSIIKAYTRHSAATRKSSYGRPDKRYFSLKGRRDVVIKELRAKMMRGAVGARRSKNKMTLYKTHLGRKFDWL